MEMNTELTVLDLFKDWYSLPQGLSALLREAGFPEGTNKIKAAGARAARAPAQWTDPEWTEIDVSGPLERPVLRRVRRLQITGPSGAVIGKIVR